MARVPIGRRNLFEDRRRAALGIAGAGVALLLVLALDGILAGSVRQLSRYIDTSPADVFVAQRAVRTMHMSSSSIPLSEVDETRRVDGVEWAEPILYEASALDAAGRRHTSYVVGFEPGGHGGPTAIVRGAAPAPGEIVVDDRAASGLGLRLGDEVQTLGRAWRISGLTTGLTNIANTVAFVRFDDFATATGVRGVASYLLVGAAGDSAQVARRIEDAIGLTAQTRARFGGEERGIIRDMTADLMTVMTSAAFLIGLIVVGLTLYAATLARLREVGIMKGVGARTRFLARAILAQATWTVGLAISFAVALIFGLAHLVQWTSPNVSIAVEPRSIVRVSVGAVLLGALGAVAPLVKVSRVDPASVFRR